jgi:eukaryotic-like serine/threonine-protein kinase
VKPHNIMLGQDQSVKLCDLGLSKELGSDISFSTTSSLQCSPAYASPEQLQGAKDCDCRTDVYSLGVTLYQMVVGELPFQAPHIAQYTVKHLQQRPPDPRTKNPALSPDAGKLILRMLEKLRDDRPEPGEVARALSRHLARG